MNTKTGIRIEFYNNKYETNHKNNFKSKVTCNKLLILGFSLTKYYVLQDLTSMLDINIICFNLLFNAVFAMVYSKFWANIAN